MGKKETDIQNAIQLEASLLGHRLLRNNIGAYEYAPGKWVHYGVGGKNWPDLIGYVKPSGRFLGIEVKRPGETPSPDQLRVLAEINRGGGIAFWVDSVEMFHNELRERI
jgi:hypothetical protein